MMDDHISRKIRKDISRWGRSLVSVASSADEPGFMYTVGLLERQKHPELIVIGVPKDVGKWLLETLSSRIERGTRLEEYRKYDAILEPPFHLGVRNVHPSN